MIEALEKFQDQGFEDWWNRHSGLSRTNEFKPLMTGKNACPFMKVINQSFLQEARFLIFSLGAFVSLGLEIFPPRFTNPSTYGK